jgi:hypothetical protein
MSGRDTRCSRDCSKSLGDESRSDSRRSGELLINLFVPETFRNCSVAADLEISCELTDLKSMLITITRLHNHAGNQEGCLTVWSRVDVCAGYCRILLLEDTLGGLEDLVALLNPHWPALGNQKLGLFKFLPIVTHNCLLWLLPQ